MIVRFAQAPRGGMKYFSPNTGAGSGGTSEGDGNKTGSEGDGNGTGTNTGSGDSSTGAGSGGSEKTFTQKELDEIISRRLNEQKTSFEKKLDDLKAEQTRLESERNGEFQKLYETEKATNVQLRNDLEATKTMSTYVSGLIDGELAEWPDEVKQTDPGSENLSVRMQWVEKMRPLAKKLIAANKAPDGEHPRGGGGQGDSKTAADKVISQSRFVRPGAQTTQSKS